MRTGIYNAVGSTTNYLYRYTFGLFRPDNTPIDPNIDTNKENADFQDTPEVMRNVRNTCTEQMKHEQQRLEQQRLEQQRIKQQTSSISSSKQNGSCE